ncbi:MAG: helix-turn-helix transcriptional regulator [Clostridia bacterium]|nr:helix-turn-helix transcriptional regulator [Clostridia bacterium]MBR2885487.1 helix-turn-helix transcriptional regulator [Clostridia bacterium]
MLCTSIKQLRTSRGLSQVELAKKLSVTKQTVSNWENDNIQPSIDMLERLSDFFNVSTDYLLGRSQSSPLSTEGLTHEQISHIALLIEDLKKCN